MWRTASEPKHGSHPRKKTPQLIPNTADCRRKKGKTRANKKAPPPGIEPLTSMWRAASQPEHGSHPRKKPAAAPRTSQKARICFRFLAVLCVGLSIQCLGLIICRGTSLIRNRPTLARCTVGLCLGPCGGPGGGAVSDERGTPVGLISWGFETRPSSLLPPLPRGSSASSRMRASGSLRTLCRV